MTVDEAIQKANAGDVDTMVILGDYYGQNKDLDNALIWYRKAAEQGNLNAVHRAFLLDGITLHSSVIVRPDEEDDETFREISHYAEILKKYTNVDIEPNYTDCKYAYAESLYWREKYSALLSFVQDEDQPSFVVLYALALFGIAPNLSNRDETSRYYEAACNVVQSVIKSGYVPQNQHHEQLFFAKAINIYASIVRIGLSANADIAGSYNVLISQIEKLADEDAKSLLNDELSHYRIKKGFFGTSITYVD